MNRALRILLLEDNASDAELVGRELRSAGIAHEIRRVVTREAFAAALSDYRPDLILADYSLPAFDGLTALAVVREICADIPFLFVSGSIGEDRAIEALKSGATDYVLKDRLSRLGPAVKRAMREAEERRNRRIAEDQFRLIVEKSPNAMIMVDREGRVVMANAQAERLFGYTRQELLERTVDALVPERFRGGHAAHRTGFFGDPRARPMGAGRDLFGLRKDGSEVPVEIGLNPLTTPQGTFVVASIIDITERKRAEERFRQVVEASPNAMIMVGRDGRIALANAQAVKLFGYPREELIGLAIERLVPHRFRGRHEGYREGFFGAPQVRPMGAGRDLFGLRKDGSEVPIEIGLNPLATPEGDFVLASIIDITERKRMEEMDRRLAALVESSDDAIIGKSLNGVITSWNRGAERLYGYRAEEAIGQSVDMLVPPDRGGETARLLERIGRGETIERFETRRRRKDGSLVDVSTTISPVRDAEGRITGASIVARDVTDQKRLVEELSRQRLAALNLAQDAEEARRRTEASERQLAVSAEDLVRSNRELEQFAYVASHDLQEPLRMVGSFMQLLERKYKGRLDEQADKYIHFAVDGARRMQDLIRDLLKYSRVARGDLLREPVDCGRLLDGVRANLRVAIAESGARIEAGPLPAVEAIPSLLSQVFQNLIDNAIKYRGDRPPEIRIRAGVKDGRWVFSVSDNGIGIEPQHLERIFVIFQRLHPRDRYPGSGIGLAITKKIVERHGGRIWAESRPGEGSTFFFTLPGGVA
jgi:PAS domain S-box-containing protein